MKARRQGMSILLLLLLCWALLVLSCHAALQVTTTPQGSYNVLVNGATWFTSAPTQLHCGGEWLSSSDGSLQVVSQSQGQGQDAIGAYTSVSTSWARHNDTTPFFQTVIKSYKQEQSVVFEQHFPQGCVNGSLGDYDMPLSHFPALVQPPNAPALGFLHYYGYMGGWDWQCNVWPRSYQGGLEGGPIVWFDEAMDASVLWASLNNFPVGIGQDVGGGIMAGGLQGMLEEVPAGFMWASILHQGDALTPTLMHWGDQMLRFYNRARPEPSHRQSVVLDYVGYSTTGFYFYNPVEGTPDNGNYQQTLLDVYHDNRQRGAALHRAEAVPYGYYLVDSFWYGERLYGNAVSVWQDSHKLLEKRFPQGLEWLRHQLGVPLAAHLGKWSGQTPYARAFSFLEDEESDLALPQSEVFWDYLLRNASGWGLTMIKQDHMNEQILDLNVTLRRVEPVRNWLLAQGAMAQRHDLTIMYCMDFANVFMNALEIPAVTHSRASNDYVPDDAYKNWKVATTGNLLWSIGLYPYKDTFYSNHTERVLKPDAKFFGYTEPYPVTHALASLLSAGPLAPSDGVGSSNVTLIMSTCRADGLILKPDRPAVNIDRTWLQRAFLSYTGGPQGEVWTTYTMVGGPQAAARWDYLVSIQLDSSFEARASDLISEARSQPPTGRRVAYVHHQDTLGGAISQVVPFDSNSTLTMDRGVTYGDITMWTICPELVPGAPILLGEIGKLLPVSGKRFQAVSATPDDLSLCLRGKAGETVEFAIQQGYGSQTILHYTCTMGPSGSASFLYSQGACSSLGC